MSLPFSLPITLDGATGSALQNQGMPPGVSTERWITENPEKLIALQRGYIAAGAGAIYAPTFGCNRPTLSKYGLGDKTREYCLRLCELSRIAAEASPEKIYIAGDMSPCGLFIEPLGESSFEDICEIFAEEARALFEAGVDFFAVETQLSLVEAKAAVTGISSVCDKPIIVTFACNNSGLSFFGDRLPEVAADLEKIGVAAFGINCCGDLALIERTLFEIQKTCALPLVAKPNAGMPKIIGGKLVYDMTPEELAASVPALYNAGARLFGGCCGSTAKHISAISSALRKYNTGDE